MFPASPGRAFCITFWYYLYGDDAGTLSVFVVNNASHDTIYTEAALWQEGEDNGEVWKPGHVNVSTIYTQKSFQVDLFFILKIKLICIQTFSLLYIQLLLMIIIISLLV